MLESSKVQPPTINTKDKRSRISTTLSMSYFWEVIRNHVELGSFEYIKLCQRKV